MLGLAASLAKGGASLLTYVKDNLKLYLDFKSSRSDTLAFPSEGSTSFDGDNDEIKIADSSELQLSTLTISAWIKPNGASEDGYIFTKFDDSTSGGYALGILGSTNKIRLLSSGVSISQSDAVFVDDNVWVHIAVTVDGSGNLVYYRNGVSAGTASSVTLNTNSVGVVIGNRTGGSLAGHYFNGSMANVAVWSRPLSLEEINSVMNKSYSQLGSVEKTSLVSWWALDTETLSNNLATGWTSADTETFTTNGANITSAVNSSGHANIHIQPQMVVRYRVYKVSYDYTLVSGDHPHFFTATNGSQDGNVATSATMASLGSSWYFTAGTATGLSFWRPSNFSITVDNFSIKEVISADSHGSNTGYYSGTTASNTSSHNSATTTTSVYGGNAPILPRAIDIAESQADAIGNGSASFDGSTDYIEIADNPTLDINSAMTLSCWVKINSFDANKDGLVAKNDGGEQGYSIFIVQGSSSSSGAVAFCTINHNSDIATTSANALSTGIWYHVAGTWDGSYNKIYLNGILQDTTAETTSMVINDDTLEIGRNLIYQGYTLNGNMAGVGLWRGALSQAQIQSLMESTSYAKIPADVKSTLGSEVLTSSVNNKNNWTPQGSGTDSANITNGVSLTAGDNNVNHYYTVSGTTTGKLYKFNVDAYIDDTSDTDAKINVYSGASNTSEFLTTSSKNYTIYFVQSGTVYIQFSGFDDNTTVYMQNISIKEVTNDLVAYYPLDADSSVNGVTNDVTTGEVLGSENITNGDFSSASSWTADSGVSINTTTGKAIFTNAPSVSLYQGIGSSLTGLYKISFDITDYTSGTLQVYGGAEYSYGDAGLLSFTSTGSHVQYVELTSSFNGNIIFGGGTFNGSIDNVSIKEVTSNTGVLK